MAQQKADAVKSSQALTYQARIEANEVNVQSQIRSLEEQLSTADTQERESIEQQVVELKRQGEIQRLQLLLSWAKADADADRIREIETALDHIQNPPAPAAQPQTDKTRPGTFAPQSK
jgi:hypothetical protein